MDRARFNAASAPSAGAWIETRPTRDALTMGNDEYRIACCYRYGWALFTTQLQSNCPDCGKQLDPRGLHALVCGNQNNEWTIRHDQIRDILYFWAKKGEFTVEKEKYGLLLSVRKPADVYILHSAKGARGLSMWLLLRLLNQDFCGAQHDINWRRPRTRPSRSTQSTEQTLLTNHGSTSRFVLKLSVDLASPLASALGPLQSVLLGFSTFQRVL